MKKIKKNKKRICIVVTNLAGSGAEKAALTQAKIFHEKGHNVVLFLLEDVRSFDTKKYLFQIVSLTKRKDTYKIFGRLGDYIYAKILKSKMDNFGKFDLVISNLPRADRVVKFLKNENKYFVIHISYKAELQKFNTTKAEKKLKLYRDLYNNENIITVAKDIIEEFKELNIKYKKAVTIYNPFDFKEIREMGKEKISIEYDYLISPSAFREQKRYDVLLDAFKLLRNNIKLIILAKKEKKLLEMIKERNLQNRVEIFGFQQNPYKFMKNAKLMILSSDYEGFGMVIVESLILNTPVVSTNCPTGPREILTGNLSEYLVEINNPQALANKIDEALLKEILIEEKQIQKFEKEEIYKQYENLIK